MRNKQEFVVFNPHTKRFYGFRITKKEGLLHNVWVDDDRYAHRFNESAAESIADLFDSKVQPANLLKNEYIQERLNQISKWNKFWFNLKWSFWDIYALFIGFLQSLVMGCISIIALVLCVILFPIYFPYYLVKKHKLGFLDMLSEFGMKITFNFKKNDKKI